MEATHGEMVVKRHPGAVAEVRGFVRLTLGGWGMDDYVPCLVATELVTNALRYGGTADDDVTLRLVLAEGGALWLEVQDTTCDLPHIPELDLTSESGRGLLIVERFTRRWGVRPLAGGRGKVVFAVVEP